MNKIITVDSAIQSCYDFELQIERKNLLNFRYSYKKSTKLKGIVFLITGFGEDSSNDYINNLQIYTANTFDVVCVSVFYHCFYARPNNGAVFYPDTADKAFIEKYFQHYNIVMSDDSFDNTLEKLDDKIQELKNDNHITPDAKIMIPMTIIPANDEYQNFGVLQALDHLNVLEFLQKSSLDFKKNYSITLVGSSHGGYIAHLCAKFAPNSIDLVIDNSSYIKPPSHYIVGRECGDGIPEYIVSYKKHMKTYGYTKTYWNLDKTSPCFFSNDRFRIRDIADSEHLVKLSQTSIQKTKYISYHSAFDTLAPLKDKQLLYETLNYLGFDATLHIIDDESSIDGKFIKNLNHGMNMSIKELIKRELSTIDTLRPSKRKIIEKISYNCDTLSYTFEFNNTVFCGKTESVEKSVSVEEIARETFLQNLAYFKKNHPDIYEKLVSLDSALEQGLYENKYDLTYQNGYFDVVELSSNHQLYGSNSDDYATLAARSVDFSQDSSVFETFRKIIISDEDVVKYQKETLYENNLSGYADILNYIQNNQEHPSLMQNIEKFIFFGVGLGTHIVQIDAKISAKVYLIIEDDLELFRLSLFITPYHKLSEKSKLVFSVFDTKSQFSNKAAYFLDRDFYRNHYLKYFQMLSHSEEKIHDFHVQIASQSHNLFFYNSILEQYLRPLEYLQQEFKFLNILKNYRQDSLGKSPVLLLAAGPSLQKNIQWLKKNHQKFIIVAVSAVLGILEKEAIKPDIVTHIDGFTESTLLFDKLNDISFFKESLFLISARTPQLIVNTLKKENVFFFENGTSYKKDFGNLSAFCVGSTSYLLLIALGVSELYLLGLDLALDPKTGKTHSDEHIDSRKLNISENAKEIDTITFKDTAITTDGNFEKTVYTTPDFAISIDVINTVSTGFKQNNQQVYNLNDGAMFKNTTPTNITTVCTNDFETINKQMLYKKLFMEFNTNSSSNLSPNEIDEIQERIKNAKSIENTLKIWQSSLVTTHKEFLESFILIIKQLCVQQTNSGYDIALVYQEYLKFISPFIFNFFNTNTKILNNKDTYAKNIKTMLCTHLLDILYLYMTGLQKVQNI